MSQDLEQGSSNELLPPQDNDDNEACFASIESVSVRGNTILDKFHLDFPANSVCAILGPSGSGKTTLMNLLTNAIPAGVAAKADLANLPGDMAIVPQDDRLHGFFTCRSYLQHYARLAAIPSDAASPRIEELLQQLGLMDQANKGTIVGDLFLKGLSGGQKRRLSVALEALSHPKHFFLDEPTSGLDAESALQVMEFLHNYARAAPGRRVFLTIHQPSTFLWNTIDHVILLSKGKLMYQGPRPQIEDFFAHAGFATPVGWNPADHYVTVVNDEFRQHQLSVDEWAERFQDWVPNIRASHKAAMTKSMVKSQSLKPLAIHRHSNPVKISSELTYRYWLNIFFNPGILMTRVAMYVMLALMCGLLFWNLGERHDLASVQSRIALSFYCSGFFVFMSVAVLPFTVMERDIVDKEVTNKYYHPAFYQLSQAISSIPSAAVLAFLVTLIIIGMTKMNGPVWYFLDMFLALMTAEALAQLVSHVVPHFVIGMALLAGMYGFLMLFQGFMIIPSDFPNYLGWLHPLALHTYAFRTAMVTEFGGNQTFTGSAFQSGHQVLEFYEIEDVSRGHDMYTLVGYCLFVHFLSMIVLHLRYVLFKAKVEPRSDESTKEGAAASESPEINEE